MFGISALEFLVILIVAVAVVPAKNWPDVARMIGRAVRWIREMSGRIQDGIGKLEDDIKKEIPIDNLSQKTMDDMAETFGAPAKPKSAGRAVASRVKKNKK
jgi:Sec-independent protein translocase protein TatA